MTNETHSAALSNGEEAYSSVWTTLPAPMRRAIKVYVSAARKEMSE